VLLSPAVNTSNRPAILGLGFRPFYLAGALFAVVAIVAWLGIFTGSLQFGRELTGIDWHGHEMVFGFIAAIIAGFLLTAVRNWTGLPTPTGTVLGLLVLCWLLPRILLLTGPYAAAVILDVVFLPLLAVAVLLPILRSRNRRNYKVVVLVLVIAALHAAFHLAQRGALPQGLMRALLIGTVDTVAILLALIGGRVIPAFTRNAVPGSTPRHERWLEILAFGSLILLAATGLGRGMSVIPGWIPASLALFAAAAHALRLALWQPQLTVGNPLLWMLPVSYGWLPVVFLLRGLSEFGMPAGAAWIHAMTAGAITSMMMAMMMRSTQGHTGRPLGATAFDMLIFLLIQLGAVLRVLAPVLGDYRSMVLASGAVWAGALFAFLIRYLPMLSRPRIDGKPG